MTDALINFMHKWRRPLISGLSIIGLIGIAYGYAVHVHWQRMEDAIAIHDQYTAVREAKALRDIFPGDATAERVLQNSGEFARSMAKARISLLRGIDKLTSLSKISERKTHPSEEEKFLPVLIGLGRDAASESDLAQSIDSDSLESKKLVLAVKKYSELLSAEIAEFSTEECKMAIFSEWVDSESTRLNSSAQMLAAMQKHDRSALATFRGGIAVTDYPTAVQRISIELNSDEQIKALRWVGKNVGVGSPMADAAGVSEVQTYAAQCEARIRDEKLAQLFVNPPEINHDEFDHTEAFLVGRYVMSNEAMKREKTQILGLLAQVGPYDDQK